MAATQIFFTSFPAMLAYIHAYHYSSFKTGRKTTIYAHALHKKKSIVYLRYIKVCRHSCINAWLHMVSYLSRVHLHISHLQLRVQVNLCRVLCEYLLIRLQRASTGTCVLTQNEHAIIFEQVAMHLFAKVILRSYPCLM